VKSPKNIFLYLLVILELLILIGIVLLHNQMTEIYNKINTPGMNNRFEKTSGRGVRIRIESGIRGSEILHDKDILSVLNELYALNLTEIAINGMRITPFSYIRCVGPSLVINGKPTRISPLVIEVIGDYEYISSGLSLLQDYFEKRGIIFEILSLEEVEIPGV